MRDVKPFAASRSGATAALAHFDRAEPGRTSSRAMITPAAQMFYDWAGGLDLGGAAVRRRAGRRRRSARAVKSCGGHATLIRAPAAVARRDRCVRAAGAACARA